MVYSSNFALVIFHVLSSLPIQTFSLVCVKSVFRNKRSETTQTELSSLLCVDIWMLSRSRFKLNIHHIECGLIFTGIKPNCAIEWKTTTNILLDAFCRLFAEWDANLFRMICKIKIIKVGMHGILCYMPWFAMNTWRIVHNKEIFTEKIISIRLN